MNGLPTRFSVAYLREEYLSQQINPRAVVAELLTRIARDASFHAWIRVLSSEELEPWLARLDHLNPETSPLWGIPFAIKDNIDLAGVETTAACPGFAYIPERSATVVERLLAAGAIPLGKTNLDQFATGLVGTRSPYGAVANPVDPRYISGGSSSGAATALSLGHCAFALGTDTAGSGRVPAAFCGLVGLKPSRGFLSTRGVVPACRSLDCVSVFAHTAEDAEALLQVASGFDPEDPFSRMAPPSGSKPMRRILLPHPEQLSWFGDESYRKPWESWVEALQQRAQQCGLACELFDLSLLSEAAELLYGGPWIAERWAALGEFVRNQGDAVHPVTRQILETGANVDGAAVFRGQEQLAEYRRRIEGLLGDDAVIALPTAGGIFTQEEVAAEPLVRNRELGTYTNFCNLLDLSALAVPAGKDYRSLPFGITWFADRFHESELFALERRLSGASDAEIPDQMAGALPLGYTRIAVVGAHLRGMPLHEELLELGARLEQETWTAPEYRLFALATEPPKPGLLPVFAGQGARIALEVYQMPVAAFGQFVSRIPWPLGIGTLRLEDGSPVQGFVCDPVATLDAVDITEFGGWKAYLFP